ncbi:hypothetical protein KM043_002336 [Ampulex compressa]|nr:hypothetical protein KM043_002336 [Ampulex compressa]
MEGSVASIDSHDPCNMSELYVNTLSKEGLLTITIRCAHFAAVKHKDQRRKDVMQTPYINHPLGVANILIQEGNILDPVPVLAAILHDTVEDTDTTFEELEAEFGRAVCNVVKEVTDDKDLSRMERKRLQIENAPKRSYAAKLVTLADKLYNLRDLQRSTPVGWSEATVNQYFKWAKAVVNGCRGVSPDLERQLDIVFSEHAAQVNEECKSHKTTSML